MNHPLRARQVVGAVLVALGLLFLARTTGLIPREMVHDILRVFWPLILVGVGVRLLLRAERRRPSEQALPGQRDA